MRDDYTQDNPHEPDAQQPLPPYTPDEHHFDAPLPPPAEDSGYRPGEQFDGPALSDYAARQPSPYQADPYRFSADRYTQRPRPDARDYYPSSGSYNPRGAQPHQAGGYPASNYPQGNYAPQPYGGNAYGAGTRVPPRPKRRSSGGAVVAVILAIAIGLGLVSFAGYGAYRLLTDSITQPSTPDPLPSQPGNGGGTTSAPIIPPGDVPDIHANDRPQTGDDDTDGSLSTPEIVRRLSPCVVEVVQYRESMPYTPYGSGSGTIIAANGYIATNAHVVAGADTLSVTLSTGEEYDAIIVGVDERTDLAVIKINATGLSFVEFGNSSQLEAGERVVVIGNPGGMVGTVTQGVVSGLEREVPTDSQGGYSVRCVQTDAAINPGNSGGPLINQFGQVVGISSAKIVDINYEGIAFAIASNVAVPVLRQLMEHGQVVGRVQLGIEGYEVTVAMAKMNDWPIGIVVGNIKNPDVQKAGVEVGDIITHINGIEAKSINTLRDEVANCTAGDTVDLRIYRPLEDGRSHTFDVTVGVMEDTSAQNSKLPG